MTNEQLWTILLAIGIPMLLGFAAILFKLADMGERMARIETKMENTQKDVDWLKGMMNTIVSFLLGHKVG